MAHANPQIPAAAFESLALVLDLSDEAFAGLLSALNDRDEPDFEQVARALGSALSSSSVDAEVLVGSFVALDRLREAEGLSTAEAAERIAYSDAAPVTSEAEVARLGRRVHALLESPGVAAGGSR